MTKYASRNLCNAFNRENILYIKRNNLNISTYFDKMTNVLWSSLYLTIPFIPYIVTMTTIYTKTQTHRAPVTVCCITCMGSSVRVLQRERKKPYANIQNMSVYCAQTNNVCFGLFRHQNVYFPVCVSANRLIYSAHVYKIKLNDLIDEMINRVADRLKFIFF